MSAHLMVVVGYLDLPSAHKLVMMKVADSADNKSRVGYPGLDAVRVWAGVSRSRALKILTELQELGLLVQTHAGHRGRRAAFKVFPDPGDEAQSVAAAKGAACPGVVHFKGTPGIPDDDEVAALAAAKGSVVRDPMSGDLRPRKGRTGRTQSGEEGSEVRDPIEARKGPVLARKGPVLARKGPEYRTPSVPAFRTDTSEGLVDADAPTPPDPAALFEASPPPAAPAEAPSKPKPKPRAKAPKPTRPHQDEAQALAAAWWDGLRVKPTNRNAFLATQELVINALGNGRPAELIRSALTECGTAVTGKSLDYQFERLTKSQRPGNRPRPADGYDDHWNSGGDFGMPA